MTFHEILFVYFSFFLPFENEMQGVKIVLVPPLQQSYVVERAPILFPHPVHFYIFIFFREKGLKNT